MGPRSNCPSFPCVVTLYLFLPANFGLWNVPTLLHSALHTRLKRKGGLLDPDPGSSRLKGVYFHSIFESTWCIPNVTACGSLYGSMHSSNHRPFNVVHDEHIYHVTCQFIQQNRIHLTENYEHWVQLRCGISKSQLLIPCAFRVKWLWKILTFGVSQHFKALRGHFAPLTIIYALKYW